MAAVASMAVVAATAVAAATAAARVTSRWLQGRGLSRRDPRSEQTRGIAGSEDRTRCIARRQLFLADGAPPVWGVFAEEQDKVDIHPEPAEGDDDLFDYAARMTLRQGGGVTLVDRAQLPADAAAAAILRY